MFHQEETWRNDSSKHEGDCALGHSGQDSPRPPEEAFVCMPTQFGGFKGQQTAFASLLLRSYGRNVEACKVSLATVFINAKNAFHCLLRQHAFATQTDFPPSLRNLLQAEGMDLAQLCQDIQQHSDSFDHAPAIVTRLVRDAHQSTWK